MNRYVLTNTKHNLLTISIYRRVQKAHLTSTTTRNLSSKSSRQKSISTLPEGTQIQILGGRDDFDSLKRYILVQTPADTDTDTGTPTRKTETQSPDQNPVHHIASLYLKRNIIFGTTLHDPILPYQKVCRPLLDLALLDASVNGDQPQGLANLSGLSTYVRRHLHLLENGGDGCSPALTKLQPRDGDDEEKKVVYNAVRAVATQIPREGHSVVGFGTYRDARSGWTDLAQEYATLHDDECGADGEARFFLGSNGVFANVEFNGDSDEEYLRTAGGAMARFFFL